jgi:two-component system CheB/CheR fusion protein
VRNAARTGPVVPGASFDVPPAPEPRSPRPVLAPDGRALSWAELHYRMLEAVAPPSIIIDGEHDIMHLSPNAGRFLQFGGGEPSRGLLQAIHPALRIELRAAIYQAAQSLARVDVTPVPVDLGGQAVMVRMSVTPLASIAPEMLLVILEAQRDPADTSAPGSAVVPSEADPLSHLLDRELERLKSHLRDTVEQYEASTEELKASNEELQAMNEELRSATEELETSREELQSINEELSTVNHELKGKVDELAHANSDLQNLMDATAIATIFLDRDLHITRYTPSAVTLFNLIPTDIGRPLSHLANQLNYPELDADARRVLQGLVPIEREVGETGSAWFLARMLPYRTADDRIAGIVVTLVDVTERRRSQEALRQSEERLRLIVDNATEYAIFSTDRELRVTSWNPGAAHLLGWSGHEILGQPCDVIFVEEDRAADVPRREADAALAEGRAADERLHQRKNGVRFWASGALMPMRAANGEVVGFVKVLRDQTPARRAQEELAASRAELVVALEANERARRQLEAADLAKDRFLAVLSHELRNPLASIAGATEALAGASKVAPVDRSRAHTILRHQIEAMRSLLDDLLDVSRLRFGRLALRKRMTDLTSVVDGALETARPLIERRRHVFVVDLPAQPVTLNVDPGRIGQVLSNLLVNAAKYTPEGGRVALRARVENDRCIIDVADNGKGLDEQTLQSMFEMFWHSGDLDMTGMHSMGIGLALVRTVVQMHDGTISASSEGLGRGSDFTVSLPLPTASEIALAAGAAPAAETDAVDARAAASRRILIVDDVEDVAWTLATVLESAGHDVRTAGDGASALALAEAFRPDVVLMDITMPGIDGHEVARRLRATVPGRRMLLIAASGWGGESARETSALAGFDTHLVKPVVVDELKALIDHWRPPAL